MTEESMMYTFRFGTSDKLVELKQSQLNCIPYLTKLVAHKDDFSSNQNENDEYVLNDLIEYTCFMAVLSSITCKQPYVLFNELPENCNICDAIQLIDYLNIDPFPLPLLKDKSLVLSSNTTEIINDEIHIEYHRASLFEACQTAAEFIIALARNVYDLNDLNTVNEIFRLIKIIVSNRAVFSTRFRHHSIGVAQKCCYGFFSKIKRRQLSTFQLLTEECYNDILTYNHSIHLPDHFSNSFAWRGSYVPKDSGHLDSSLFAVERVSSRTNFDLQLKPQDCHICKLTDSLSLNFYPMLVLFQTETWAFNDSDINSYEQLKNPQKYEAKAARSGYFNTLPKRPKVDKFKHRVGPKAQTYR